MPTQTDTARSFGPPGWEDVPVSPTPAPRPAATGLPDNRRDLDGARVIAWLVDCLVLLLPTTFVVTLFDGFSPGAALVINAVCLTYFFLMESLTGQTVGKRAKGLEVARRDGRPLDAKAVGARTILRLIDGVLIGPITLVLTGGRRQRLGDLAGGTVVARSSDVVASLAPPSPLTWIYPIAWISAGVAVALLIGPRGEPYLADVNAICKARYDYQRSLPQPVPLGLQIRISLEETRRIEALSYPRRLYDVRSELLNTSRALEREATVILGEAVRRSSHRPPARLVRQFNADVLRTKARLRDLGLDNCAK